MHGELCIHLVIPAAGTLTIITQILQRPVQRERQREREIHFECVFCLFLLFASLQGFSVHLSVRPQYTAQHLNNITSHSLREVCIHFVCSSSNMMAIV